MTVRLPTDEEKERAKLVQQGIWPGPAKQEKVGAKGAAEAQKRFGKAR